MRSASLVLYSIKIKDQTRKLAADCSKYSFEVADETDEVTNYKHGKATLRGDLKRFLKTSINRDQYISDKDIIRTKHSIYNYKMKPLYYSSKRHPKTLMQNTI